MCLLGYMNHCRPLFLLPPPHNNIKPHKGSVYLQVKKQFLCNQKPISRNMMTDMEIPEHGALDYSYFPSWEIMVHTGNFFPTEHSLKGQQHWQGCVRLTEADASGTSGSIRWMVVGVPTSRESVEERVDFSLSDALDQPFATFFWLRLTKEHFSGSSLALPLSQLNKDTT